VTLGYGGVPVTAGEFPGWTPIGAEIITTTDPTTSHQTPTGYEVAWQNGTDKSTSQYTIWNTDLSGGFVSQTGVLAASSQTLINDELSFHQDLNGDGFIGPAPATTPAPGTADPSLLTSFAASTLVPPAAQPTAPVADPTSTDPTQLTKPVS
jgi:serralysin